MIFCTPWFLAFSLAVAVAYLAVRPWLTARLVLLLVVSVVFYFQFAGLAGFLVIAGLATFTYLAGLMLHARLTSTRPPTRLLLVGCLVIPAGALIYFRYYAFFADAFASATHWLGLPVVADSPWRLAAQPLFVPLGISFFAFEFCHYLYDVYHRAVPVKNPLHFSIFAFFYPRLASGPIVRFQQIVPQLAKLPPATLDDVSIGLLRISTGFAKKFLLADPAAQLVSTSFQVEHILQGPDVLWLSLLLYVRIYMDFAGYCDMAIGLGRLWGIRLPENFNFPFLATSPSTFWQRWHITLSTWIRDYLYIPLGGSRVPAWRKALNLLLAMAICGLWHGAAWNFVLWGIAHGLALQVGHALTALTAKTPALPGPAWVQTAGKAVRLSAGWAATQLFVGFSWVLFFFPAESAWQILAHLKQLL